MSSVDERIVEMRFDNRQFESNVNDTMKTINKLKGGLNFDDSARSLSNLERAGKSFSLGSIAESVDAIKERFSTLGIIGMTAIANLTNSAMNLGKNMIKSLTIDPIKMGFDEYETKMGAIQTILTNTANKGTTIEDVNKALNELNTYADKTIYNFSEMTKNIGTFTAAGIDLKTSTESIKGIANLAAGSGSSAQQASMAMYQLSQAMAAGTVKLMDWNSVVNAGMGGQLFQKALEKTAVELGHGRDMSVSFRESLEKGWITTDVLTKTLQKFAADESLLKAATQVKTFTQLFDTMKESVQSGWAQTWETIIGNKDEAAGLLTEINNIFGGIISSSAQARNSMLAFWKDNGGRNAIIEAMFNAFKGLQEVLSPIGQAFKEIFPPMTGKRLVEISDAIRDLTRNFKVSDETAANIKSTFKGLFAVLDIGKQAFMAIASGLGELLKYLLPAGSGLLSITGDMGNFLVSLDTAIKKAGLFGGIIGKLVDVIKFVGDRIKMAVGVIVNAIKSIGNIDTGGIDSLSDHVTKSFRPFTALGKFVETLFTKIADGMKSAAPVFYALADIIGGAFDKLRNNIVGGLENGTGGSILDLINGGLFAAILLGLKRFVKSLTDITDSAGGFLGGITGILDGVKGSLQAYQSSLKANTLLKIAAAIGVLAVSLSILAGIDQERLTVAMTAMTGMFIELFASMAIFQKAMSGTGFIAMGKITIAMMGLSVSILILTDAVTKLAKLDWEGVAKGLAGVAGLSAILIKSAQALSTGSGGLIRASVGFIIFGAAIDILATSVRKLGSLDPIDLAKGLIGVGTLCAELSLFMKAADFSGMSTIKSVGFIALAAAVSILATAVQKFVEINTGALIKGLLGVGAVLAEIALFVNVTGDSTKVISTSVGLIALGAAMLIFESAVEKMGSLSIEQIGKGLLTMAGALTIIATALNFMPKNMILTGTGLVVVASSLIILSDALKNMGGMSWEGIAKGLITLAGSLTIIATAMAFMETALPGAAALIVISAALSILAPCLEKLGNMSLGEIGKGLLALAGIFTVIGIAGLALAPLTPVILGLSAAIALFGVACVAVGVGMLAFSTGLAALAVSGTAGAAALTAIVTSIIGLIPFTLKTLAKGIVDFSKVLADGMPVIAKSMKAIFIGIIDVIISITPKIMTCLVSLVTTMLKTLVDVVPKMVDSGMKLILGILKGIGDNITKVTQKGIDVILQFISGVISKLPEIVDAAFKIIIGFLNGLAQAIDKNHKALYDAAGKLIMSLINALTDLLPKVVQVGLDIVTSLLKGLGGAAGKFVDAGKNVIKGFINGLKSGFADAKDAVANLGNGAVDTFKNVLGIHSPSKVFQDFGAHIVAGLQNGIKDNTPKAVTESKDMAKKVTQASKDEFDKTVQWMEDKKYYNQLSLQQELSTWEMLRRKYADNADERKKADKEIYRVKQEMIKASLDAEQKTFDKSRNLIDDKKYYNKESLQQELADWKKIQSQYKKGSEERIQADKEVYRVQQELIKAKADDEKKAYDKSVQQIEDRKYYNQITLQQELTAWQNIQSKYKAGSEERKQADKEVYRLKQELIKADQDAQQKAFDDSVALINERKYYNQLSLAQELAAWLDIQSQYKEGSEQRKEVDREVYRVKQEMIQKQKELDDDYYSKNKEINDKLQTDIKTLNDAYDQALKSRTDSLYATYGLFDKLENAEAVSGKVLIDNLRGQVDAFESWQKDISALAKKGIDDGLLKELENMGPKSSAQIKALNELSAGDLNEYVTLWKTKSADAKTQALSELDQMRIDTLNKIKDLNTQADKDLDDYKKTWISKTKELTSGVGQELTTLSTNATTTIDSMKTNITDQFTALTQNIKTIFESYNWRSIGYNIIDGISGGIMSAAASLAVSAAYAAKMALDSAKSTLGIHSPSTEFAKVGMYADQGFAIGLNRFSDVVAEAGANTGNTAINSLRGAIANMSDVISGDLDISPTIRPVLDLSDVEAGGQQINKLFDQNRSINVGSINGKIPNINTTKDINDTQQSSNSEPTKGTSINFVQNNYSPKSLSRIDIYRQTNNQISALKGLVRPV